MFGDGFSHKAGKVARSMRSRRAISVYKGALAYTIGFILIFLRSFDDLNAYPVTFTAMTIILIIGGAGKSFGACIQSTALALIGVGCGAVGFVILAELSSSQVAQGFVFAALVYGFALIKAKGLKWFPLALLAILMSFNGIYTSLLVGGFRSAYLEEYLKTYSWGGAIVLLVNILVLPISSERELRQTLLLSLEHISTFLHLLAKGYTLEITEEERSIRDHLAQSIRADFGLLSAKIDDTFIEINYSRFSTKDYRCFVTRIRRMQQSLITAYSSLVSVEKRDAELFKTKFLPDTLKSFNKLRAALNTTMREISLELGCPALSLPASSAGYAEFMDIESQEVLPSQGLRRQSSWTGSEDDNIDERLSSVARRLAEELGDDRSEEADGTDGSDPIRRDESAEDGTGTHSSPVVSGLTRSASRIAAPLQVNSNMRTDSPETRVHTRRGAQPISFVSTEKNGPPSRSCIRSLRRVFDAFCINQHDIMAQCLCNGQLHGSDDTLRLFEPLPSIRETYQYKYVPSAQEGSGTRPSTAKRRRRRRTWMDEPSQSGYTTPVTPESPVIKDPEPYYEIARERTERDEKSDEVTSSSHHSLTRVYSFLFAMEQFVTELEAFFSTAKKDTQWQLRIHYFPKLNNPYDGLSPPKEEHGGPGDLLSSSAKRRPTEDLDDPSFRELSIAEAVALLEHRTYTKSSRSIFQHIYAFEEWLRGPSSIYAAKTAAAASVYAVLLLHPVTRPWFIDFGMVGGALTIVTALQPTLGQSVFTFILQILGSGFGYVWALVLLEIFNGAGGYHYNPYGIVAFLFPYALVFYYILYNKPQFFVAGILALNGTGTVLITEWIYVEYLGNNAFDSPGLRFGKAFTTLGVALGLVAVFQLFVLRNPARRSLRKRIGAMLFSQLSYLTLLQAFVRSVMPTDPKLRGPEAAIERVAKELRRRELKLQSELITLRPLVKFAANEAKFQQPFQEDVVNRILRTSQIMLDRMRESRVAISSEPLPDVVLRSYVQVLAPYRRRNSQVLQLGYYLVASSILAKAPLLRETPAELESAGETANFMHDMLVLAGRHARTSEGALTIRSGSFTRYFHYLVGITSLNEHLRTLEDACKDLFGELEDHLT